LSKIPPRTFKEGADAGTGATAAYALQAFVYQNAIVVIEFHDVGNGSQGDEIKQTG
jgi:hypothetical protein